MDAFSDCRWLSNFILNIPQASSNGQTLRFGSNVFYYPIYSRARATPVLYYNGNNGWLTDSTGSISTGTQASKLNGNAFTWNVIDVQRMTFKLTSAQTNYSVKPGETVTFTVTADKQGFDAPITWDNLDSQYATQQISTDGDTATVTATFPSEGVYNITVKAKYASLSDYSTALTFTFYVHDEKPEDSFDISPTYQSIESKPKKDETVEFTLTTVNHDKDDIIWIAYMNEKFDYGHLNIVSTDTGAKLTASFDIAGSYIVNVLAISSADTNHMEGAVVSVDVKDNASLILTLNSDVFNVEEKEDAVVNVGIEYSGDQAGAVPQWDDVLWSAVPSELDIKSSDSSMDITVSFNSARVSQVV